MGSRLVGGESGVTLSGPGGEHLSESSSLRGMHLSGSGVTLDDLVIVIDVGLEGSLSLDCIRSLLSESSKLLSPSGDSRVL